MANSFLRTSARARVRARRAAAGLPQRCAAPRGPRRAQPLPPRQPERRLRNRGAASPPCSTPDFGEPGLALTVRSLRQRRRHGGRGLRLERGQAPARPAPLATSRASTRPDAPSAFRSREAASSAVPAASRRVEMSLRTTRTASSNSFTAAGRTLEGVALLVDARARPRSSFSSPAFEGLSWPSSSNLASSSRRVLRRVVISCSRRVIQSRVSRTDAEARSKAMRKRSAFSARPACSTRRSVATVSRRL